jgi:23S rRNA (cytosine1962-C5)-methyltransferase
MDQSLITHRLNVALSLRQNVFSEPAYRLVFGDSDRLPGLVIDRFEDVYVVQISSAGMERLKEEIIAALDKVCRPKQIVFKNDGKMRAVENLDSYVEVAKGEALEEARFTENGVHFIAPILTGQKTGWFFDHRMNRARLKDYVKGKRVLDLYSYVGGWGVQAAAFGAESVTCVDSSAFALDYVQKNAELNQVQTKVSCIEGDVFEVCKQLKEAGERFDVVVADPPAFIPRRKDQKAGELAYQRLNQLAMRLLSKDGLLVSASCSMHLSKEALVKAISLAGQTLEKQLQIIEQGAQGPDHPVIPVIPETDYLKAIFVRVLPA